MTAPMTREELLPCPFCAGPAEYFLNPSRGDNSMARCRCCGAEVFGLKWNIRDPGVAQGSGWQPIETAPLDGTRILLFQIDRGTFEGWWKDDWPHAEHYWMDDADSEPEPTHWRPLLAPPSNQGASK